MPSMAEDYMNSFPDIKSNVDITTVRVVRFTDNTIYVGSLAETSNEDVASALNAAYNKVDSTCGVYTVDIPSINKLNVVSAIEIYSHSGETIVSKSYHGGLLDLISALKCAIEMFESGKFGIGVELTDSVDLPPITKIKGIQEA